MEISATLLSFFYALVFCCIWKIASIIWKRLSPDTQSAIIYIKSRVLDMVLVAILAFAACYLALITIKVLR